MATKYNSEKLGPSRRTPIDIAEADDLSRIIDYDPGKIVRRDDLENMLSQSAIMLDGTRRKPRYFDGRMLVGADLARDQDYIRQRQNDLASATGIGVIEGLRVAQSDDPRGQTLSLEAGHGVTPSGAIVMLEQDREISLNDIPEMRRLDATLGLSRRPNQPLTRRNGLFIVALRPVEFTANPLSTYPTEITGKRRVEDGDIIEATAITLIEYPEGQQSGSLADARRAVARQIFSGTNLGTAQDALPLAMVALERGVVRWIDMPMVRREVGADTPLQVSLGSRPRSLSEAFVLQYRSHLQDIVEARQGAGQDMRFPAREYFSYLPPAGIMPAGAITTAADSLEQIWFPPGMDVNISFVPADEVPTLIEESLTMPPIDLEGGEEAIEGVSVVALVPVPRAMFHQFAETLDALALNAKASASATVSGKPVASLNAMLARRAVRIRAGKAFAPNPETAVITEEENATLQLWKAALSQSMKALPRDESGVPMMYYVRRRAVAYSAEAVGRQVEIKGDTRPESPASEEKAEANMAERLGELGLKTRYQALTKKSTAKATARINEFLNFKNVAESGLLTITAIKELEEAVPGNESSATRGNPTSVVAAADLRSATRAGNLSRSVMSRALGERAMTSRTNFLVRDGALRREMAANRIRLADADKPKLLSEADVAAIATDFKRRELGQGILRLAKATDPKLFEAKGGGARLANSGIALEVDLFALKSSGSQFKEFAKEVATAIEKDKFDPLKELLAKHLRR